MSPQEELALVNTQLAQLREDNLALQEAERDLLEQRAELEAQLANADE